MTKSHNIAEGFLPATTRTQEQFYNQKEKDIEQLVVQPRGIEGTTGEDYFKINKDEKLYIQQTKVDPNKFNKKNGFTKIAMQRKTEFLDRNYPDKKDIDFQQNFTGYS